MAGVREPGTTNNLWERVLLEAKYGNVAEESSSSGGSTPNYSQHQVPLGLTTSATPLRTGAAGYSEGAACYSPPRVAARPGGGLLDKSSPNLWERALLQAKYGNVDESSESGASATSSPAPTVVSVKAGSPAVVPPNVHDLASSTTSPMALSLEGKANAGRAQSVVASSSSSSPAAAGNRRPGLGAAGRTGELGQLLGWAYGGVSGSCAAEGGPKVTGRPPAESPDPDGRPDVEGSSVRQGDSDIGGALAAAGETVSG